MANLPAQQSPNPLNDDSNWTPPPDWQRPFYTFLGAITFSAFTYASLARTDTGAIVVGSLAAVAIVAGLVAMLTRRSK